MKKQQTITQEAINKVKQAVAKVNTGVTRNPKDAYAKPVKLNISWFEAMQKAVNLVIKI